MLKELSLLILTTKRKRQVLSTIMTKRKYFVALFRKGTIKLFVWVNLVKKEEKEKKYRVAGCAKICSCHNWFSSKVWRAPHINFKHKILWRYIKFYNTTATNIILLLYAYRSSQSPPDAGKRKKSNERRDAPGAVTSNRNSRSVPRGQPRHFGRRASGHSKIFKIQAPNGPFSNPTRPPVR